MATSQQTVTIRAAEAGDSARCQEIAVAAWEPIHARRRELLGEAIYARLHSRWQEEKAGQIAASFERHLGWIAVATVPAAAPASDAGGEEIAGFVTYRLDAAGLVGEIGNNAVDPAWQGRGIASALYWHVLAQFREAGMKVAKVTTGLDEGHAPALATYRKVGFDREAPSVTLYQEL
jgi:ribosomal protein S18 acetylase RimI-like enzyme